MISRAHHTASRIQKRLAEMGRIGWPLGSGMPDRFESDYLAVLTGMRSSEAIQNPSVVELDNGNVVMVGLSTPGFWVFDSAGRVIETVQGRGGGPGEFQLPSHVVRLIDARFGIVDLALRRFTIFDASRTLLNMLAIPSAHEPFTVRTRDGEEWLSENAGARRGDSIPLSARTSIGLPKAATSRSMRMRHQRATKSARETRCREEIEHDSHATRLTE